MTQVKGIGRRRTQLLDDLRNKTRYWELKGEAEDGNDSLLIEHKEGIQVTSYISMYLLISSVLNNNNNNNKLTPWLMEPGGSMPHSQGLSNNPYPELNQPNYPH